jgi:putative flippase GtrA
MNRRPLAFIAVGAVGFVVQMTVLAALTFGPHWSAAPATALAVETAVLTNFLWHDRWTWRDRTTGTWNRLHRLWRFQLTNGITSIVGNVIVTMAGACVFHVTAMTANIAAVIVLGVANYMTADRWVFASRPAVATFALLILSASPAVAAELQPETVAAWNRHVANVEATLPQHERDAPVLTPEGRTIDVPGGAIHEWRGSIFVRGTTVGRVVDALLSPGSRPLQEDVAESRVLERQGDSLQIYLKLVRKLIVTVTYDTEHDVRYVRRSPSFATSRSVATRIVETGGSDRGFLWRLNSYWRYRQAGDGVQIDVLSLSLSRDIPWMVKPIAQPIIDRIGRESMSRTLETVLRNAGPTMRTPVEDRTYRRESAADSYETRQMELDPSSDTISEPSAATATLTGRPHTSPLLVMNPVRKSS